jgi:hypothetical protein
LQTQIAVFLGLARVRTYFQFVNLHVDSVWRKRIFLELFIPDLVEDRQADAVVDGAPQLRIQLQTPLHEVDQLRTAVFVQVAEILRALVEPADALVVLESSFALEKFFLQLLF